MNHALDVIVPVYNSATTLTQLLEKILAALEMVPFPSHVILVDDGSSDGSWRVIDQLTKKHPSVRGIRLSQNMGQQTATIAGLQASQAELCITMDDDGEHPADAIPQLLAALNPELNLIYGAPKKWRRAAYPFVFGTIARWIMAFFCHAPYLRYTRTLRLLRRDIYPWQELSLHPRLVIDGLLSTRMVRATKVRIEYAESARGTSTYRLFSLTRLIFRVCLTGIKKQPLAAPRRFKGYVAERTY